jgi:hypothetical protein
VPIWPLLAGVAVAFLTLWLALGAKLAPVTIEYLFRGLPADEVKLFLHTNVKRLYNLDYIPDTLPHAHLP